MPLPLYARFNPEARTVRLREETSTEEFARLLDEAESHRLRSLPFDALQRLARLYRGEPARLSRLRDRGSDLDRVAHLNALCVRAHGFLYSAHRRNSQKNASWLRALVDGLAGAGTYITLSWALLATGTCVGFFLVRMDPTALYALMPDGLGYGTTQIDALYTSASARDLFFTRESTSISENALFGSTLFANNTRVGLIAFAVGILGGLPTLLLQFYNGLMIGSVSAIFLHSEHALLYLAWILPHGVPELTAITLCSAGGLVLGHAVAAPGRVPRSEALQKAGPTALALVLTSIPLFFAAAWIESFVRQSALGTPARLAVAAFGAIALTLLALLIRRRPVRSRERANWLEDLA
jgi:uncharacterized membrane protein SpoIIM required for sporulation